MARKCPSGVFCIDNVTLLVLVCIIGIIIYMLFQQNFLFNTERNNKRNPIIVVDKQRNDPFYTNPNYVMSRNNGEIFLNPYAPPLKRNPFFPNHNRSGVPINVPTSHYDLQYRQVGILTRSHGKETILALFGRPLHSNRNKWQYYTMTDKNNLIKLPVSKGGKSCTATYGCDEIYNGDSIYVEGYNDGFQATIYDNAEPRYIPYL